jgi:HNH endonuclease/NUMOD4 motif
MHDDFWRPISGYPNYQVSRSGQVQSLTRNRLLAQVRGPRGYYTVNLYRNGRPRCCLVHRLVAAAFLGVIPAGWQVNHMDGRKDNNCLDNLEIVTAEANRLHAQRKGLLRVGEANHKARLTENNVRDIRRMRAESVRVRYIARQYDVSERAIYLVCRRLTWKHVA